MPVHPSDFEYQFSPSSLVELRGSLGISQANLAERMGVPVNTVSRWERGETTPDANSLAAIYSIAMENGALVTFFRKGFDMVSVMKNPLNGRKVLNGRRSRLVMIWDFQNVPLSPEGTREAWFYMDKYLDIAFPGADDSKLRVYSSHEHREAVEELSRYFDNRLVWGNADNQMIQDIRNLCGLPQTNYLGTPAVVRPIQSVPDIFTTGIPVPGGSVFGQSSGNDPKDTVLVFVSKDAGFSDILKEAREAGVDVYLWAPPGCSQELLNGTVKGNIIPWGHPKRVVSEDNLRPSRR